jgi:glycosyltransferase involved in cell wall biosynthesis
MKSEKIKKDVVLHIISGLNVGGAESMLVKLLCNYGSCNNVVISLMDIGPMGKPLSDCGIPVHTLKMKRGSPSLKAALLLLRLIKDINPNKIMGWMYHANIASLLAKILFYRRIPIIWNIRHTPYDLSNEKRLTSNLISLGSILSFIPETIVYNSYNSLIKHESIGYSSKRSIVIPNGFDIDKFSPKSTFECRFRRNYRSVVVGHVARFHPMKNHKLFLESANYILQDFPDAVFVMAGRYISYENKELMGWIKDLGLMKNIVLCGEVDNVHTLINSFDIFCLSSSWGEGFPNVIGEAMASGVPCVATNIGDSKRIIGNAGIVVEPDDFKVFGKACCKLLKMKDEALKALGLNARYRMVNLYSIGKIVKIYKSIL